MPPHTASDTPVSKPLVLAVAMMSAFLAPFTSSSITIALPAIASDFSLHAVALNWVATAYLLAGATFLLPFGRLADIHGRKKVFQIGIAIDALAAILCASSQSGGWLIASRALQGFGGSMIFGTSTAILTSVYPPEERGRALGFSIASVYLGLSLGPVIGGLVTEHIGWRGLFLINVVLDTIISAVVLLHLKGDWADAKGEGFDYAGSVLYAVAMIVLIYALSVLPDPWGFFFIAIAAAALVLFVLWETRQEFPVMNVEFFRTNSLFVFSNLAALINYSATFAVGFLLSLYLQYIGGFTAEHAGFILIMQPVVMVVFSPIAGILSDRIEPRIVASIGMVLTTVGLAMLAFIGAKASLTWVFASQIVLGAGFGLFSSPNTNAVMSSVARKFYGVASGTLGTMRLTGQALSQGFVLLLFSLYIGKVEIGPANYPLLLQAMKIAFAASAVVCFLGIFASAARGRTRDD